MFPIEMTAALALSDVSRLWRNWQNEWRSIHAAVKMESVGDINDLYVQHGPIYYFLIILSAWDSIVSLEICPGVSNPEISCRGNHYVGLW